MSASLSGMTVAVDKIIFINSCLTEHRRWIATGGESDMMGTVKVPEGHRSGGVSSEYYDGYRQGLASACADVVITTYLPCGRPAVLASKRASNKPFGGKWWMQGGAIHSYRSITDFVCERAEQECGVRPVIEGFIGVFMTCADDFLACTINLCYVGYIPAQKLGDCWAWADKDHTHACVLTGDDLARLPEKEKHWYPMLVFNEALDTMSRR